MTMLPISVVSYPVWEQLLCESPRLSEPESLQAATARDLNVHLIPGRSCLISLMWVPRLESREQLAGEGKKKEEGKKYQHQSGGVKIGKEGSEEGREEEGGRRGRGGREQGELGPSLQSTTSPPWANTYLTSSLVSAQCRTKTVSSMNVC